MILKVPKINGGGSMKKQNNEIQNIEQNDYDHAYNNRNVKKHFKKLRTRLIIGLTIGFVLPHAVLSFYFHFQFTKTLKKSGKVNLTALAVSKGNTIDLFLQERIVNLFNLFHSNEFNITPSERIMRYYLQSLSQASDAFIDVGFLNSHGIQTGYAGSFPFLQGKDYSKEQWFNTLKKQKKKYYISDIYLGFRNKPHFTIATKQVIDGKPYTMRATLDPDKFYIFLRNLSHGKEVESALINSKGLYQIVDPGRSKLLGKSEYMPPITNKPSVQEIKKEGDSVLIAYTWLKETDWALLVRQPLSIAHAQMYHARRIITISLTVILIVTLFVIFFITNKVIAQAQKTAEKRQELHHQLIHVSKLASVGELATGVAHEINNPLAIITATVGVVRDMFNPEFNLDSSPENVLQELEIIDSATFRARGITRQLLDLSRKNKPKLVLCNVNDLLRNVISGLKEREFKVANIKLDIKYDQNIPETLLDQDQITQVFMNLVNNAGDAISGHGKISISTKNDKTNIYVTVKDSGEGMALEQIQHIFNPFYTTKEVGKGTGLGLSISLSIVRSMGGEINVQSLKGSGSSFTVSLPIKK